MHSVYLSLALGTETSGAAGQYLTTGGEEAAQRHYIEVVQLVHIQQVAVQHPAQSLPLLLAGTRPQAL